MAFSGTWSRAAPWLGLAGAGVMATALFVAAGPPAPEPRDPGTVVVSRSQIDAAVEARLKDKPGLSDGLDQLRQEIEEGVAAHGLLVAEGFAQGLAERDQIVQNRLAELQVMVLYEKADAKLTPEAVEQYFQDHRDQYRTLTRRQYLHLFSPVTNVVSETEARTRVERMLEDRGAWGEPRWVTEPDLREAYGPSLARKVFESKISQWEGPLRSGLGWHCFMVVAEEPARAYELSEVRERVTEDLRRELRRQAYEEELERLQKKYRVQWSD